MLKKELKFNIAQSEAAFVKACIFNNWVKGYDEIMQHLRDAVDTEDFINKILGDPDLATTQAYAEVSKKLRPDSHWYKVREMFGDNVIKTSSDAGSVKIGVANMSILVPNGYGDGITRISIFDNPKDFNDCMMSYFTTVKGTNIIIYDYDCGDVAATTISGRYAIYYYSGLVAFVKTGEEAE
jgi:hypothetical protein